MKFFCHIFFTFKPSLVEGIIKPGNCPVVEDIPLECPESDDEEQCLTDDACEGDMRCCSDGCMLKCTPVEPAILVQKGEVGDPGDAGNDVIIIHTPFFSRCLLFSDYNLFY